MKDERLPRFLVTSLFAGLMAMSYLYGNKNWHIKENMEASKFLQSSVTETATLGGGCFWCLEAIYERLRGVVKVESGYSGGTVANPTYEAVCSGVTGHAEVCRITFDPSVISYRELLEVFFDIHDPTSMNRQGNDIGTQYRSVIFYHTPAQEKTARELIASMEKEKRYNKPVVTQVVPFDAFYIAENYHQNYFSNNPAQPYCSIVISPKVKKFEKKFEEHLKNKIK